MNMDSQIFDFMEKGHGKEYLSYLFMLYDLETEDGYDLGQWPTYEMFLEMRAEELNETS